MLKKLLFPIILVVLLVSFSLSQSQLSYATLEGIVTSKDRIPVEGAKILVLGTDCTAISDEEGKYFIKNIPVLGEEEKFLIEVIEPNNNVVVVSNTFPIRSGLNKIDFQISLSLTFSKYYGDFRWETSFSVKETRDANYIISGISSYAPKNNIYLLKVDRYGRKIWGRTYLINKNFTNSYVIEDDKGYLISATSNNGDIYLLKTSTDGGFLWEAVYGRPDRVETVNNVILTDTGDYLVVGRIKTLNEDGKNYIVDALVIKFDKNGNKLWDVFLGEKGDDEFSDAIQARNGDFILVGTFDISGLSKGVIYRIDKDGRLIWNKKLSGEGPVCGERLILTDQGYLVGGYAYKDLRHGFYLAYLNDKGDILWRKNYNSKGLGLYLKTISMVKQYFVVAGYFIKDSINKPYIMITDFKGEIIDEVMMETSPRGGITSSITTKDLYTVFVGFRQDENDRDIWLYKTKY
ncbi:MAG: hypothetical protein ABDH34_05370 [Dictyoglomus thermophilum]